MLMLTVDSAAKPLFFGKMNFQPFIKPRYTPIQEDQFSCKGVLQRNQQLRYDPTSPRPHLPGGDVIWEMSDKGL
jgi:hypothetical protein